jgi:thioredoxin-related protein
MPRQNVVAAHLRKPHNNMEVIVMQINGVKEFLSRFVVTVPDPIALSPEQIEAKNTANQSVTGAGKDIVNISEPGKRLSLHLPDAMKLGKRRLSFRSSDTARLSRVEAQTGSDPALKAIDRNMSAMAGVLGKMKALTVAAEDVNLSNLERIDMQIEMEDLRKELQGISWRMYRDFKEYAADFLGLDKAMVVHFFSSVEGIPGFNDDNFSYIEDFGCRLLARAWKKDHSNSLLGRARDRIMNGEEWNIREKYQLIEAPAPNAEGDTSDADAFWGDYFLNGPKAEYVATDDKNVRSVREKLEDNNTIILMDAKSAAEGTDRLDKEIKNVKFMREKFAAFCESRAKAENTQDTSAEELLAENKGHTPAEEALYETFKAAHELLSRIGKSFAYEALPEKPDEVEKEIWTLPGPIPPNRVLQMLDYQIRQARKDTSYKNPLDEVPVLTELFA